VTMLQCCWMLAMATETIPLRRASPFSSLLSGFEKKGIFFSGIRGRPILKAKNILGMVLFCNQNRTSPFSKLTLTCMVLGMF
ncbi:hypothetical protein HN51_050072, partial [Arachis hypogaea]